MSIRLNKAIKEFGVGLQSITDLLKEKGVPVASNDPNQKLDDKQYDLLKKAFSADKNLRDKAEERMQDRQEKKRSAQKAKKAEDNVVETVVPEVQGPHIVGHIDLETAGKSKKQTGKNSKNNKATKAEAHSTAPAKSVNKPQDNAATAANTPEAAVKTGVEEEAVKAHADNSTSKPQPMTQNANGNNNKPSRPSVEERAKAIGAEENGVFKLKTQTEISGPKVLGTIDLSAINPTTRPKKKSKDERRRERNKQNGNNQGGAQGAQGQGNGQRKCNPLGGRDGAFTLSRGEAFPTPTRNRIRNGARVLARVRQPKMLILCGENKVGKDRIQRKITRKNRDERYFEREQGPLTQPPWQAITSRKFTGSFPDAWSLSIEQVFESIPLICFALSLKSGTLEVASVRTASVTPQLRAKLRAVTVAGLGTGQGSHAMTSILRPARIAPSSSNERTW